LNRKATPNEADVWLRECEKIYRVIVYTVDQQLTFTIFLFVGDAKYWWAEMQQQMQTREEAMTWTSFRARFLEKYFPNTTKHEREAEFLTLQQGHLSVQAYVKRFEYFARFYS